MTYKDTVFLPKTSLPTKASKDIEKAILDMWVHHDAHNNARRNKGTRGGFTMLDGPPYANGNIHIGHALNKILKDITVRAYSMADYVAEFRPGWDCHGLPIEWKVEEEWRKKKRDKNAEPEAFKQACREYASMWVEEQKAQFQKLGIDADWKNPYLTMDPEFQGMVAQVLHLLVKRNLVYSAHKPTLWSPIEKTALAEAETVDREHVVPQIWVKFKAPSLNASVLVWTTTPWSLPGNVGVAFNPASSHSIYDLNGEYLIVSDAVAEDVIPTATVVRSISVAELEELQIEHPIPDHYPIGHAAPKMFPALFVKDSGTGFVHVGPEHSVEDWSAWRKAFPDADYPSPVMPNGQYADWVPLFAGMSITKGKKFGPANDAVVDEIRKRGNLFKIEEAPLTVQHSWRSDAILLTLATRQWFINLDEIKEVFGFYSFQMEPLAAKSRMMKMIKERPDWLISRQRLWGSPMSIIVNKHTGEICRDYDVLAASMAALNKYDYDWEKVSLQEIFDFVNEDANQNYSTDDWEKVTDVLDVWFDSGCVAYANLKKGLAIEGIDQTRGWFQSCIILTILLEGHMPLQDRLAGFGFPFTEIRSHGFVLDANGRKMSKSEGNVIDPLDVVKTYGVDALRVWVATSDWKNDVRVSKQNLENSAEIARKIRNTLRYLVAALGEYKPTQQDRYPELESYVLGQMFDLDVGKDAITEQLVRGNLTLAMNKITNFCNLLSSLMVDVRKDLLYCGALNDPARVSYLNALSMIFDHLVKWVAPIMPVAAEEMWGERYPDRGSVHAQTWDFTHHPHYSLSTGTKDRWERILNLRDIVVSELEKARAAGMIKSSNEALVKLVLEEDSILRSDIEHIDIAELCLCQIELEIGSFRVTVERSPLDKCERCWRSLAPVGEPLCSRCEEVLGG